MTKTLIWVLNFRKSYQDLLHQGWVWSWVWKIYPFFSASSLYCFWSFSFLVSFSFMLGHSPDLKIKTRFLCMHNFSLNLFIILSRTFMVSLWNHSHNSRPNLSQKVSLLVTKVVNGVWVDHWLAYNGVKVGAGHCPDSILRVGKPCQRGKFPKFQNDVNFLFLHILISLCLVYVGWSV